VGQQIDIAFLELMASKVCHDLISPIGAISNGIEFMEEMGPDAIEEAVDLLKFSATQASAKLQAYRMAYGAGGGDISIKPEDVHKSFAKFIQLDKKITQDWDPHADIGPDERSEGFSKLLMCALLLSCECLPKGGVITVDKAGQNITSIKASGQDAALKPPMDKALSNEIHQDALEPRYVHAYMSGLLAKQYGFQLEPKANTEGGVEFHLISPAV